VRPLTRLRLRLTAWYAGTFSLILLALGVALFTTIAHRIDASLVESLRLETAVIERAARIREAEGALADRVDLVDAFDELVIPGRSLYLFDGTGHPIARDTAWPAVRAAAAHASLAGYDDRHFKTAHDTPGEHQFQLHAERFHVASGHTYVAVAAADRVELEDRYAHLIVQFAAGAAAAMLGVSIAGWYVAAKAVAPIEENLALLRRFVADAAHELRTPVAVMRSRAEVALQRARDPADYVDALGAVGLEAERMGRIVNDLLMLAQADAGERPIARESVFVDDIALDAVAGVRVLAERRGVELEVSEYEEAPALADPMLVRQLLVILLDNAVKFTPSGGRVTLGVRASAGSATVTITDTGVGIAPAELARVFDRFYRGADARARADGAGLGLSIARWIADAHGAALSLAANPRGGTIATVEFPSARPAGPVPPAAAPAPAPA
jgi:signal transduction histidine kinase